MLNNSTPAYDNNGNLITKTLGSNITSYSWDFNDMLPQVTKDGNTYTYRYDGLGNRIARIENGVEKRYVGVLAETDVSGNITAYYVHGVGLISKVTPSNQAYYYHYDGIGSTVAISDSTGAIVNRYAYDPFGQVVNQEETIPNPFKYVGQFGVMDEGNGLLYMRARYYDPEAGRFISKDPMGCAGGDINLYSYVANNPVNGIDPWGLIRAVFNAGGHIWIPPTAGSFGLNFSSEWWGLSYYKNEYKGMSKEFVIGSLWDVGVSAGISGLSGCENGTERTLAFGLGKYLGFQFTFKGDKLDAITAGWGRGWSLPVTFTIPWNV